jgi:hydroxyacylglutathione hydrolase
MQIETVLCGSNCVHMLIENNHVAVVDPGVAEPVRQFLDSGNAELVLILVTHHHGDHTGGCTELRQIHHCRLVGPPGGELQPDHVAHDGDTITFAGHRIEVLSVPGHTKHDLAYYLPEQKAVFTGDVLFSCGCGRVFSGDMERMWTSLCRLRALPGNTRLYGGHDYTDDNLDFAAELCPEDAAVQARLHRFRALEAAGTDRAISTLAEEKETNPFLRCDVLSLTEAIGMAGRPPADVFASLRRRKDFW